MVKNLKNLRLKAKMSQHTLAEVIGVSQQSINKYENHSVEPDIETLIALAAFFNVSVDYLIGNTDITEKADNMLYQNLSQEEIKIISWYRKANKTEKEIIRLIMKNSAII